jgi:hypothetical protein
MRRARIRPAEVRDAPLADEVGPASPRPRPVVVTGQAFGEGRPTDARPGLSAFVARAVLLSAAATYPSAAKRYTFTLPWQCRERARVRARCRGQWS